MDKSYLKYPNRKYGSDHDFYDWRLSSERPKLEWSGGAKVAVTFIIPLEFFPLNPSGVPFKAPGAMATPYPDLRHFTVRDYGNRVGVYRILEELDAAGVKATFAVQAEIAKRYLPLVEAVKSAGHEIVCHGVSTDHLHHEGLKAEAALVDQALSAFESPPSGWLSPARNQSSQTLRHLAKAGVDYCLDWEPDSVPVTTKTDGGDITLIPNNYELSDFTLLHTRKQTEESWQKQIVTAIDYLAEEHDRFGGQMLGLMLTPYIIGQPFRIAALRSLLAQINARADVSVMTTGQINTEFKAQS